MDPVSIKHLVFYTICCFFFGSVLFDVKNNYVALIKLFGDPLLDSRVDGTKTYYPQPQVNYDIIISDDNKYTIFIKFYTFFWEWEVFDIL